MHRMEISCVKGEHTNKYGLRIYGSRFDISEI